MSSGRKERARRGQRVSFTDEDSKPPVQRSDSVTGLRFTSPQPRTAARRSSISLSLRPAPTGARDRLGSEGARADGVRTTVSQHVKG